MPLSGSAGSSGSTERLEPRPKGCTGLRLAAKRLDPGGPRNGRARRPAEPSILEPNGERLDPALAEARARRIFTKLYLTEKRQQSSSPRSVVGH
jgi:hypothetical protein